jgi:hypothetical protein
LRHIFKGFGGQIKEGYIQVVIIDFPLYTGALKRLIDWAKVKV